MKPESHIEKAQRIEHSTHLLDKEEDWELIVEGLYGAAMNYIAAFCEKKFKEHQDTHKGLIAYLKKHGEYELASLFQELEEIRIGRWYGGKRNGESAGKAKEVIEEIKELTL